MGAPRGRLLAIVPGGEALRVVAPDRLPDPVARIAGDLGKRGFVLLPRRWVVERAFAWASRFRRLARDDERLDHTLASLHYLAFACLRLQRNTDSRSSP